MIEPLPPSYCEFVARPGVKQVHLTYHDDEYGFPSRDESVLFERLILEINQAGLSWETILLKRDGFRRAYSGFDVDAVAAYAQPDIDRLLADPGIIRNRLKVAAAIHNAQVVQELRSDGGFAVWLDARHPLTREEWVKTFRKDFKFVGGEIVGEFLMSLGYLPGAHVAGCPVHDRILHLAPPWTQV